jgi:protein-L-isoaspartate(D-aspartate) O-methyltransferase
MVQNQLRQRGISDKKVLEVISQLPRQHFIPPKNRHEAYFDRPVPIGLGQTISQPYIVALMTENLNLQPRHQVLEIGTGCGYQTAILARLVQKVYTIELLEPLGKQGRQNLTALGINNVEYHIGDGSLGWPEPKKFDRILVGAAAEETPPSLLEQLAVGGKMVIPVGKGEGQKLLAIEKSEQQLKESLLCYCRFVKLVQTSY